MTSLFPKQVLITEVGARDGLQNEKTILNLEDKIAFINALSKAGFRQIEFGSFVSPKWVPQMANSAEIYARLEKKAGTRYIALVPNLKGLEAALQAGVDSIAVFTAASETFTKKNINRSIDESLTDIAAILKSAKSNGLWVRGYVSTCFGCPYEGEIDPQKVLEVSKRLTDLGVDELSLGDTIGVAAPNAVESLVSLLGKILGLNTVALHFHDTRGTALANILMGLSLGITRFDSSAGGLGGCPYAPGAAGNMASEDLIYMLNRMGIQTGVDLDLLASASAKMSEVLGRTLPSRYLQSVVGSCETEKKRS